MSWVASRQGGQGCAAWPGLDSALLSMPVGPQPGKGSPWKLGPTYRLREAAEPRGCTDGCTGPRDAALLESPPLVAQRCPLLQAGHQETMRPLISRFQKSEPCEKRALEVRRRWAGRFWVRPDLCWVVAERDAASVHFPIGPDGLGAGP